MRKRKRSANAQETLDLTVEAVVCDLTFRELEKPGGQVHISQSNEVLRKRSRNKGRALSKTLPDILKVMSAPEMGYNEITPGKPSFVGYEEDLRYVVEGKQTAIAATPKLVRSIKTFGVDFADIGRSADEEVILLRGKKQRSDIPGPLIDCKDTDETNTLRDQVREINQWLEEAEIDYSMPEQLDRKPRVRTH